MDQEMSRTPGEFRFLTTEEFNGLTQSEKMDYLARAVEATLSERVDGPFEVELFVDPDHPSPTQHPQH